MVTGTMFGKRYSLLEYFIVCTMVCGLVIFLHADARSAVFHPIGVAILVISLICDGVINNWSEATMSKYRVGHNEFLLHLYSIAFLSMTTFTYFNGELLTGIHFLSVPGTYSEARAGHPSGCTPFFKVMALVLLTTTGLFGSSCAAGITKYFGVSLLSHFDANILTQIQTFHFINIGTGYVYYIYSQKSCNAIFILYVVS